MAQSETPSGDSAISTADSTSLGARLRDLLQEWGSFARVLFAPWTIVFLALSALFGIAEATARHSGLAASQSEWIVTVLAVMFAVSSGMLGGILAKKWDDLREERVIVARGEGAIRGLILVSNNIASLQRRVGDYLRRHSDPNREEAITREVIRTYLEEVIRSCSVLNEEVLSSIDDWKDTVPSANIRKQAGIVEQLQMEIDQQREQTAKRTAELVEPQASEQRSQEQIEELRGLVIAMERKITTLRQQQRQRDPLGVGATAVEAGSVSFSTATEVRHPPAVLFGPGKPMAGGWGFFDGPIGSDQIAREPHTAPAAYPEPLDEEEPETPR